MERRYLLLLSLGMGKEGSKFSVPKYNPEDKETEEDKE